MKCWTCGCPSFLLPARMNGRVVVQYPEGGMPVLTHATADGAALNAQYDDPSGEGPECLACSARLWDDPALAGRTSAELESIAETIAATMPSSIAT